MLAGPDRPAGVGLAWLHQALQIVHDGKALTARFGAWTARIFLPRACHEVVGMTDVVTASDLDWTIVRFLQPIGGPRKGAPWPLTCSNQRAQSKGLSARCTDGGLSDVGVGDGVATST